MPLYGPVPPSTGSPALQGDPFYNYPNAGIRMTTDPKESTSDGYNVAQIIPDIEHPDNVQTFNSGAIGHPSAEQIWAFKARQLAADVYLLNSLVGNMTETVPPGRGVWATGINQIQIALTNLQNAVGTMCEDTRFPKPN